MGFTALLNKIFGSKEPKVACPKCGTLHEINADCKCPKCGLKYKLPSEYDSYIQKAKEASAASAQSSAATNPEDISGKAAESAKNNRMKKRNGTIIRLSLFAVLFSAVFLLFVTFFFRDKNALLFKTGEYENQPVFYHTEDGTLHCAFPNKKSCGIGKGELVSYISSADGKCVYLVYSGNFASSGESNYVLRISKFGKKTEVIHENKEVASHIVSGGNNEYLYILTPINEAKNLFVLSVSENGEKPVEITKSARELAVSTNGRYALINLDDSGSSKLMVYSVSAGELTNPGIKNAHPLSIDNKGEYMIYARKSTAESTDIIVEKSTTERVEIPIFTESSLKSLIFSEDRHTFAAQYSDKTVFYSCGDKDYTIANTYEGSVFGYDFNDNVCHNYLAFKEIPKISNVYGKDMLPYYFYDKEHSFVYRISRGGTKESVFNPHVISDLRVSENGKCAFVANDILYTGKLSTSNNDICVISNFTGKKLVEISPDGKYVYYTDADGNLFRTEYGKNGDKAKKIAVDPDIVKPGNGSDRTIVISDGVVSVINKKGKTVKICDSFASDYSVCSTDDLSAFFYTAEKTDEQSGEKKLVLYFYDNGKPIVVADGITDICNAKESLRIDFTKSDNVDTLKGAVSSEEQASDSASEAGAVNIPTPISENNTTSVK